MGHSPASTAAYEIWKAAGIIGKAKCRRGTSKNNAWDFQKACKYCSCSGVNTASLSDAAKRLCMTSIRSNSPQPQIPCQ